MNADLYTIDTNRPVLVTGATGYVAGWVVRVLLEAGVTVHAAVRNPDDEEKIRHLIDIAQASPGDIRFFRADLLTEGSYDEAARGCGIVFHTASPFTINVKDPQKDLLDPAVLGTRNVLGAANRSETVERVVLTSSCAAIYTDAQDTVDAPGGRITEDVWNGTSSLDYQPYSLSKTLAEKAAWEIAGAQDRWKLVVVNPSLVMGPALNGSPTSESFNIIGMIANGTMKAGAPRMGFGIVDVRDLAQAHLAAAYIGAAEGRHIISGHDTNLLEAAKTLLPAYGESHPIPRRALPKWLLWLVGPSQGMSRRFVSRNVNVPWRADNTKSRTALGVTYRPLAESMTDMFAQFVAGQERKK